MPKSHRLDVFTYITPSGLIWKGSCTCGYIITTNTVDKDQARLLIHNAHDEHIIKVLEQVWAGQPIKEKAND